MGEEIQLEAGTSLGEGRGTRFFHVTTRRETARADR